MEIATVKMEGEKGDYVVINESDFDEKKHKLFVEKAEKAKEPKESKDNK